MPPPGHCPWAKPERWGYVLDRHVRRIAHPRGLTLLGGEPPRLLTLGHRGVAALDALCARPPRPLPDGAAELARRLVDGALLHPVPLDAASCGSPPPGELGGAVPCGCFRLAAVVPAHAPPPGLSSLVRGLTARGVPVQVVDDGSPDGGTASREAVRAGGALARLVVRPERSGPSAVRNTEPADADLLAFLDADTVLDPADPIGWLVAIAAHFHDERVGLVAPRVQAAPPVPGRGAAAALGRYEGQESPLDLGEEPGRAGAGRRLSYVPAAAIVVRRRALAEVGWFDEDLRFGEDVDLVRRLDRAGWTVRYEPSVIVLHDSRGSWRAFARQRAGYGSSAAELHARHPGTVPPFAAPPLPAFAASAAAVAAVAGVSGRSRSASAAASAAVAATLVASARLRKAMARVGAERPLGPAVKVAAASTAGALVGLLSALRRGWWPALLPLAGARRARRGTLALLGASTVAGHLRPAIAAAVGEGGAGERARRVAVHLAIGVLDDAAYTAGVWQGCWRRRSLGALAPSVRRRRRLPRGR